MEGTTLGPSISGNPTVSVLIAAYNASRFLRRAVQSALAQTLAPLEVLIVDDASTDDTRVVANALAAENSRVRILTLPVNSGPAAARNVGLNAARGDWVAILDADDAYLPSHLETLVSALVQKGIDIVLDNILFFDTSLGVATSSALFPSDAIEVVNLHDFLEHARPYGDQADWGLLKPMFRLNYLDAHSLRYAEYCRHGEDFFLMFRALHAGARCILVRDPGYLYSTRDSGMSRTTVDYELMLKHMTDLLDDPAIKSNTQIWRLLRQCIADLKILSAEYRLGEAKEKRDYLQLALLIMTNMSLASRAVKSAYRKIERIMFRA